MDPVVQSRINLMRAKIAQGEEISIEEQIDAVKMLRADRYSAAVATTKKAAVRTAKAAAVNINGDDLLSEMM